MQNQSNKKAKKQLAVIANQNANLTEGDRFVTDIELESLTGLSRKFWQKKRGENGPPFYKIGRACRYRLSQVFAWLDERQRTSTSDSGSSN